MMAIELVFHKYQGSDSDYLVYDINKNHMELDDSMVRKIRNRSFGADLAGILIGPFVENGDLTMKVYGVQNADEKMGVKAFSCYLKDAGYVKTGNCVLHTPFGYVSVNTEENEEPFYQTKIYCWC